MFFAILTAELDFPFPRLWYGEDLRTMKPYSRAKREYSWISNCVPLSEMHSSGISYGANCLFLARMIALADVFPPRGSSSKKSL